ncbi:MAG: VCBS repeat-containing protein [Planctomycetes bacterium]|nr:VCBS repeat-containing protein [Planctomycetota bacterium]
MWFENPSWAEHVINNELGSIHSLAVGDLNQDGKNDIVYNSNHTKVTGVFTQNTSGQFEHTIIDEGNSQQSYGCTIIDVDGDNKNDILLGGRQSNNVVWYRQQ